MVPSPENPVKEGAGWAIGVWDDRFSTAAILAACPEDRLADFFRRLFANRRVSDLAIGSRNLTQCMK